MSMKVVGVCAIALTAVIGGAWMMDNTKKAELRRVPIATTPAPATEYFHGYPSPLSRQTTSIYRIKLDF
jgi:hypothetical protein